MDLKDFESDDPKLGYMPFAKTWLKVIRLELLQSHFYKKQPMQIFAHKLAYGQKSVSVALAFLRNA